jgi:hypothetical protein
MENDDPVFWLKRWNEGDPETLAKDLRGHLKDGTFSGMQGLRARWALWRADRAVMSAKAVTTEGIALRQVIATERTATAANIAIGVSLVSLAISVYAIIK